MAQLAGTYGFELDAAQAGQKVDLATDIVDSFKAEGAVPFGRGVVQGTADDQCKLPTADTNYPLGVAIFTHAIEQALAGGAEYADKDMVSVVSFGRVWMDGQGKWDKNDTAYVVVSASASLNGTITADTTLSGATGFIEIGRFLNSGEDELAQVEITRALQGPQGEAGGA